MSVNISRLQKRINFRKRIFPENEGKQPIYNGFEYMVAERGYDCRKRSADNDADRHIHYVAARDKLLEFPEKALSPFFSAISFTSLEFC